MANYSIILAWEIPWTEEPGELQSMASQRAGHDWACPHISNVIQYLSQGPSRVSLVAQMVKNLPTMQETWVQFLGWENPLEKGMATQPTPVFLPGEFHGQRSLDCSPWGCKKLDTTERLTFSLSLNYNMILQLDFTVPRWENGLRFPCSGIHDSLPKRCSLRLL